MTDHLPKPLLPVAGRTLLGPRIAAPSTAAGARAIAVNTHHLADRIADHLRARPDADRFHLSFHETEILGTGGALDGARAFSSPADDFLVYNGDVLCDADLARPAGRPPPSGALATLLLVDWPEVNTVTLGADGACAILAGSATRGPAATTGTTGPDLHRASPVTGLLGRARGSQRCWRTSGRVFRPLIDPLVRALVSGPAGLGTTSAPCRGTWPSSVACWARGS